MTDLGRRADPLRKIVGSRTVTNIWGSYSWLIEVLECGHDGKRTSLGDLRGIQARRCYACTYDAQEQCGAPGCGRAVREGSDDGGCEDHQLSWCFG